MQIKVRSLQGDEFIVQVQVEDQLVSSLKASISEQPNGPPVERQKLIYKGRTMQDSLVLSEYNLEEDCKVHLIIQKETQPTSGNETQATHNATTTTTTTSDSTTSPLAKKSPGSPCPMDISSSSRDDGKPGKNDSNRPPPSRFELILRERLAHHFPADSVDKIMANLYEEIDADINNSSLDDLERLAKQKLNITNE